MHGAEMVVRGLLGVGRDDHRGCCDCEHGTPGLHGLLPSLQNIGSVAAKSGQADVSGDLSVAFPVGVLAGNLRIRRRGLHAAVGADGAPGAEAGQSSDHRRQAYLSWRVGSIAAICQGPLSMLTSTRSIGAPQAMPT